jgi:hypothetical protein
MIRKASNEQIIASLKANGGFVSRTAESLGMTQQAIYKKMREYPEVKEAFLDIKSKYLDLAESKLIQAVNNGASWAVCFYLKCQGKDRGWIELQRHEVAGKDGEPLIVSHSITDYSKLDKDELRTLQAICTKLYSSTDS